MSDPEALARHYASLTDAALAQDYARGRDGFASDYAWDVVRAEAARRGLFSPSDSTAASGQTPKELDTWIRTLADADLLHIAELGSEAYGAPLWDLIVGDLRRRGLPTPPVGITGLAVGALDEKTLKALTTAQDEKAKESDGAFAFWVFLGTAIVTLLGLGKLFSLGGIAYLAMGSFIASVVLGLLSYGFRKLTLEILLKQAPNLPDQRVTAIGFGLMAFDFALMVAITRAVTLAIFG